MNFSALLSFLCIMLVNWAFIYSKTEFNPNDINRKYITIKNRSLAKLFIQQRSHYVKYNKVKDRLKLNIPCFVKYVILAFIFIIAVVSYFFPEMHCEPVSLPFSRRHSIILDTYNAKIPYTLAFIMAYIQVAITIIPLNIKMFKKKSEDITTVFKIGFSILSLGVLLLIGYLCYALIK